MNQGSNNNRRWGANHNHRQRRNHHQRHQTNRNNIKHKKKPQYVVNDEKYNEMGFYELQIVSGRSHCGELIFLFKKINKLFYNDLSDIDRININELLFQLFDKHQPDVMNTNCIHKTQDKNLAIHWKLQWKTLDRMKQIINHLLVEPAQKDMVNAFIKHLDSLDDKIVDQWSKLNELSLLKQLKKDKYVYDELFKNKVPDIGSIDNLDFDHNEFKDIDVDLDIIDINFQHKLISLIPTGESVKSDVKLMKYKNEIDVKINQYIHFVRNCIQITFGYFSNKNKLTECIKHFIEWYELQISIINVNNLYFISLECIVTMIMYIFMALIKGKSTDLIQRYLSKYDQEITNSKWSDYVHELVECKMDHHMLYIDFINDTILGVKSKKFDQWNPSKNNRKEYHKSIPFNCTVGSCLRSYDRKDSYLRHMKQHKHLKEYQYDFPPLPSRGAGNKKTTKTNGKKRKKMDPDDDTHSNNNNNNNNNNAPPSKRRKLNSSPPKIYQYNKLNDFYRSPLRLIHRSELKNGDFVMEIANKMYGSIELKDMTITNEKKSFSVPLPKSIFHDDDTFKIIINDSKKNNNVYGSTDIILSSYVCNNKEDIYLQDAFGYTLKM